MNLLKASKGKVVITPPAGTPMAGNIRSDNKSRGVHDDLFCSIIILKDDNKKICFLGFDLIGLEYSTCNEIRTRISECTDIPSSNVMIWATHTHSGPDTGMRMYQGNENAVASYLGGLVEKVAEKVKDLNNFEEVRLKAGKILIPDLSFNRRLVKNNGSVVMNFESFSPEQITGTTGPVDQELIALSLWDNAGRLYAILVNFSLHPAILVGQEWLISRDFIHYLDKTLIENYGKDVVMLYANGAEGNINHLNYHDRDQMRNFAEAERVGKKLGDYVEKAIRTSVALHGKIKYAFSKASIPFRSITKEEIEWARMVIERDRNISEDMFDGIPDKTYARMILEMTEREETECDIFLQGMAIHNFAIVTFPGEVYAEFGLKVKELSPYTYTMIIGLANGQAGYIPDSKAFEQGGYEIRTAWTSQLAKDAGEMLVSLVGTRIIDNLNGQSVRTMERQASDNKYLHRDFHAALNMMLNYILDNFGEEALKEYLEQYSGAFHKPLNNRLKSGDKELLADYFREKYRNEEWPVRITASETAVVIEQEACPGIAAILARGEKPCRLYVETYASVYRTLCEGTPFEYSLDYFDNDTGACRQRFTYNGGRI
ncbi:MAG: hypothetical protein GYA41_02265 [Bacteroidales bacterium]|nr:hypothetical protein [Bacteroidales bacterium]